MKGCGPRVKAGAPALLTAALLMFASISWGFQTQHAVFAEEGDGISITIGKQAYNYCEKLSYVVSVPEVTGDMAIAHIIDHNGKSSQAIPIPIEETESEIRAPFPFEESVFPTGTYTISMTYGGYTAEASFELDDAGNACIPNHVRQIAAGWVTGSLSDGFMIDAIKRYVDPSLVDVPFEISQDNIYKIAIPQWVKTVMYWWVTDMISDDVMAGVFDYMLQSGSISVQQQQQEEEEDQPGSGANAGET